MPTNLPPEYFRADKRFREAQTPAERIACLEELISTVPKHKGTDHLRAGLRRQLSQLREEAQGQRKHDTRQANFHIEREGAGQAALIGAANVGKSALFDLLRHVDLLLLVVDLQADPLHQLQDTLALLAEHRIAPLKGKERFADEERITRLPALLLVNKCDDPSLDESYEVFCAFSSISGPVQAERRFL